jgi:hypothetical protein
VNSKTGHPETTGADCGSDGDEADVDEAEKDFLRGGEVVAPEHVKPEDAGKTVCNLLGWVI